MNQQTRPQHRIAFLRVTPTQSKRATFTDTINRLVDRHDAWMDEHTPKILAVMAVGFALVAFLPR